MHRTRDEHATQESEGSDILKDGRDYVTRKTCSGSHASDRLGLVRAAQRTFSENSPYGRDTCHKV